MQLLKKIYYFPIFFLSPLLLAFFWNHQQKELGPKESLELKTTPPPSLVTQVKQITFEGPRAGEGYFNKDGSELVFQSERYDGNPFYQIYKMNLKTGKTDLISTGKGQTTCAWIHPSGKKILFSSTHLDPLFDDKIKAELAFRKQPTQKYAWSFDENYDIFSKDLVSDSLKKLTHTRGYDAEGSYSPDGQWIVFASNRAAYNTKLSNEIQKKFELDGSLLMDIYIMKADGTQLKQLTHELGYDGGPFFSHNGKQITWRRFTPDGKNAEIYTMNVDGSEQKPITRFKSMSWSPYFHPSGKYIIFTTNVLGFQNFELYIVDVDGKKEPVRVTYEEGFDGLPVFSPDGLYLTWTKRNNKGESQIYMGEWDHQAALRALNLDPSPLSQYDFDPKISVSDLKEIIYNLSSSSMQGRLTGSPQEKIYAQEIARLFEKWGLKAPPTEKSFIHEFNFLSNVELGEKNTLTINGPNLEMKDLILGKDWNPVSYSSSGELKDTGVVFAGYGLIAPPTETFTEYNSYRGLNVKNKWVIVFRDIPNDVTNELRYHLNMYSRIQHKVTVAKNEGAKGLIIVSGPRTAYKQKLPRFQFEGALSDSSLPVINIDDRVAEILFKAVGKNLEAVQKGLDDGSFQEGFDFEKISISSIIDIHPVHGTGNNILGYLKVPGAKETIFIGAHGDHLGKGLPGVSLATSDMQSRIHFGSDDNASGVSAALELAHYFSKNKANLKSNIVFAIWSGEELGNLGSKNYLKELKKKDPQFKIKAYINMDMIGRFKEFLYIQGLGSGKEWRTSLELIGRRHRISLLAQDDPYLPTDAMSFYVEAKSPVLSFFTGPHKEYHTPLDTPEKINLNGLNLITSLIKDTVIHVSDSPITFKMVESSRSTNIGRKFRVYLGTIPDYSQEGIKGVKISGTSENSPAEKSGLKSQDIIVEIAGQKVENLYDFTYALQTVKPNTEVDIKVLRASTLMNFKITPVLKE